MTLPPELVTGFEVTSVTPVRGGDICQAYRVATTTGPVFLKTHAAPTPQLFEREARGLAALRAVAPQQLRVPKVLAASPRGLVLEWIDEGTPRPTTEQDLGAGLAQLHRHPAPHFGGLDGDEVGYLGSVAVDLTASVSWPEFYLTRRLYPLTYRAVELGRVPDEALRLLDAAARRGDELWGPSEAASLVHGDLWAGNRLVDAGGRNWLIDPAVHYGHRETDLAMMTLFGGFGTQVFGAYHEAYPLAEGWRDRVPWYQLSYLLVHAILFGGGYGASVLSALRTSAR